MQWLRASYYFLVKDGPNRFAAILLSFLALILAAYQVFGIGQDASRASPISTPASATPIGLKASESTDYIAKPSSNIKQISQGPFSPNIIASEATFSVSGAPQMGH